MFNIDLPDIEKTLVDLALGLLRAPNQYAELVRSESTDNRGEIAANSVRVTQHYVAGLLAYGFDVDSTELQHTKQWFTCEFPNELRYRIDSVEMTRLEALLLLDASVEDIAPRLEQLTQQRLVGATDHFLIDPTRHGGEFDTLWTLKVMLLAEQRGLLNGLMTFDEMKILAGRPVSDAIRSKDMALALRLRYELNGQLDEDGWQSLERLIYIAEQTGGVWGVLAQDFLWIVEAMRNKNLTASDDIVYRQVLREMVLSTCYVIENLAPLVTLSSDLAGPLQRAMELWWGVFHGEDAAEKLQALFSTPYDYLTVLARTLVAVRACLKEPLIQWDANRTYNLLAKHNVEQTIPPQQNIKQALRKWFGVALVGEPERLRLGMSGTDIVRVKPRLYNPMLEDEGVEIMGARTLVIKSGPLDEINQERANYGKLSENVRDCFALVPEPIHIDDQGQAILILQDLHSYQSLEESLPGVQANRDDINRELGPFLLKMHTSQKHPSPLTPEGLLWELYLLPIQTHIQQIFAYIMDAALLGQRKLDESQTSKHKLLDLIGELILYQFLLEDFPIALMHGDLHSRNIMLYKFKDQRSSVQKLDFKLIDLEKLRVDGDVAFDAGELLADLNLLARRKKHPSIMELSAIIYDTYMTFAREKNDTTFSIRLELAQARALLRVAKGRTKAGRLALEENRRSHARKIIDEILEYVGMAILHLQHVLSALQKL